MTARTSFALAAGVAAQAAFDAPRRRPAVKTRRRSVVLAWLAPSASPRTPAPAPTVRTTRPVVS